MCASWRDLFALPKCVQLAYLRHLSLMTAILQLINFTASCFFSLLINAVILLLNCLVLVLYLYTHFLSLGCYFLYLTLFGPLYDTVLKVSRSLYGFTTICHGVENFFPRLLGTGINSLSGDMLASSRCNLILNEYRFTKMFYFHLFKVGFTDNLYNMKACKIYFHYQTFQ